MPRTIIGYTSYRAVAMHLVYGFVGFSFVLCVAVLNVFVGAEACHE
jgi:hypothetical protein